MHLLAASVFSNFILYMHILYMHTAGEGADGGPHGEPRQRARSGDQQKRTEELKEHKDTHEKE